MNKKELSSKIRDLLIIREDDGSYYLFGKFCIIPDQEGNYHLVDMFDSEKIHSFTSLKTAVTYCVFEKNKKYKELRRIIELDDIIGSLESMIEQHSRIVEKTEDFDYKSIVQAKLLEEKLKKRQLTTEINSYIALSKYWQTKQFAENEAR